MSVLLDLLGPYVEPRRIHAGMSLEERLASGIDMRGPDECWPWMGALISGGYGQINAAGRTRHVHRVVYEILVGPVPDGLTLDHECHTREVTCNLGDLCPHRRCCNPAHLEPVTQQTNVRRGRGLTARNAVATHCKHGHEFTLENTYRWRGHRMCRQCVRNNKRALRTRRKDSGQ